MIREDLVRMRRSMAMAPSLPRGQTELLLDELERLMAKEPLLEALSQVIPRVLGLLDEVVALTSAT